MAGKGYQNRSGKIVPAKRVREVNCKCHYKCLSKIEKAQQEQMLDDYLTLDSERARWAFISQSVNRIPVKRRYSGDCTKREHTLQYTVLSNGQRVQVCKKFFLATFENRHNHGVHPPI